jgi:hypothetical protein
LSGSFVSSTKLLLAIGEEGEWTPELALLSHYATLHLGGR